MLNCSAHPPQPAAHQPGCMKTIGAIVPHLVWPPNIYSQLVKVGLQWLVRLSGFTLAPSRPHLPMASSPFSTCLSECWSMVPLNLLGGSPKPATAYLASRRTGAEDRRKQCCDSPTEGSPWVPLLTVRMASGPECSSPSERLSLSAVLGGHRTPSLSSGAEGVWPLETDSGSQEGSR